ncbi:hypothetical protein CDD80_1223 [Ophiocordyceps camponoti-rufipedis]|uniref:Signal recognition particle subunit SRP68 n=1 Tax=Ophiocordyceps camponoti-rufipedis TaxID=2004952 RepID=A0A2C5ZA71_9HYPO|nr:hypothetical protein CDD80_1223 [Ophiocordyceps camponoti-rufipedis]
MDITAFVVGGRDKALLYGDYATYHSQLAKRLLNSRKKLGIATRNRGKFHNRDPPTADLVAANQEYVHLLLLTSERAWAQAMSFKTAHAPGKKIPRRSRSHIVSRLQRAVGAAQKLAEILSSAAPVRDVLEAKAYAALLQGAMQFEKRAWQPCLQSYAVARSSYTALAATGNAELFKDLLSETIDPYIRYAAYQLKTPRTVPIPAIVAKAFPWNDTALVDAINQVDSTVLAGAKAASGSDSSVAQDNTPKTLTWRSRQVQIEDAQISQAWASVLAAKSRLADDLARATDWEPRKVAAAYDELLTATQDAVDAAKQAIDELKAEGVAQSDTRMQSLLIARTAVNYEMISWRIGRNRVLTGPQDGAPDEHDDAARRRKSKAAPSDAKKHRPLPLSKNLARLREKVALYDGTLQSLQSIKDLPGVAADELLAAKLSALENYFQSLRHLSVARSHSLAGNFANALALLNRATTLRNAAASIPTSSQTTALPLGLDVAADSLASLATLLHGELHRHRALVHITSLRESNHANKPSPPANPPLIDRLHECPIQGVDLDNLVDFPPTMHLVPLKPIFLDVAWNYIAYPGKASAAETSSPPAVEEPASQPKRGWFSFGR